MSDDRNAEQEKGQHWQKTEALLMLGASTAALGFPVPPTIAKNIISAVGALVTAGLAVPTAYLQAWAQGIYAKAAANEMIVKGSIPIVLSNIASNNELTQRATTYLTGKMLIEQKRREEITGDALNDLRADPPTEDAKCEIEEDWLDLFARHAERKSNKDMQAYFSRVLAGEIRKPGSFSPATIEVLARLTPQTAKLFQDFCNISGAMSPDDAFVLAAPFGEPADDALSPLGFPVKHLWELQEAGLIGGTLGTFRNLPPHIFTVTPLVVGGTPIHLTCDLMGPKVVEHINSDAKKEPLGTVLFSSAGQQLRRIVHMTPNPQYVAKFIEWAERYNMHPANLPSKR